MNRASAVAQNGILLCRGGAIREAVEQTNPAPVGNRRYRRRAIGGAGVALALLLVHSALAQFSIPWWTIDAGGGTSSGGVFRVSGTLGQPEAGGPMTGGPFTLTGGFWVLPQVVQTPDAPTLSIAPAAPGWATLTWTPAVGVPWVLQEAPAVTGPWSDVAGGGPPPRLVPATPPARFYRLYKP